MNQTVNFLNVRFDRMTFDDTVALLLQKMLERSGGKVFYANAHTMVTAARSTKLREVLDRSDFLLADGSGVRWGSALFGTPLTYNLNGTDLVPALCRKGANKGLSVYLLGGKPGVAKEAAANLVKAFPGLVIAGTHHGYYRDDELPAILTKIQVAQPHLLLVAKGVPLQEIWIDQYASQLPGIMCMGVGGLFDFLALRIRRAPYVIRRIGMEWCWRLAMEPGRMWKRYLLGNVFFIGLLVRYSFTQSTQKNSKSSSTSVNVQDNEVLLEWDFKDQLEKTPV